MEGIIEKADRNALVTDPRTDLLRWILRFAVIGIGLWAAKQVLFYSYLSAGGYLIGNDRTIHLTYLIISLGGCSLEVISFIWFRSRGRSAALVYFFVLGNTALMIACYIMIFRIYGNFFTILLLPGFISIVVLGSILTERNGAVLLSLAATGGYVGLVLYETRIGVLSSTPAGFLIGAGLFLPLNAALVGHLASWLVEKEQEVSEQNRQLAADRHALVDLARSLERVPKAQELLRLLVEAISALVPGSRVFVVGRTEGQEMGIIARSRDGTSLSPGWETKTTVPVISDSLLIRPLETGDDLSAAVILEREETRQKSFTPKDADLLQAASSPVGVALRNLLMSAEIERRDRLKEIFGRYVAKQLLDRILASPDQIQLGGNSQKITILFADIRGFTSMSESMEPDEIVQVLNEYFSAVTDCITSNDGMLDKFIGDGIMALFGVPINSPTDALKACRAALQMQNRVTELNSRFGKTTRWRHLGIGIGLNTGTVTVGNIGCPIRMDYTAIGDPVNLASRLEGKAAKGQVLLSENCYREIASFVEVEELEPLVVKGKKETIQAYLLKQILDDKA